MLAAVDDEMMPAIGRVVGIPRRQNVLTSDPLARAWNRIECRLDSQLVAAERATIRLLDGESLASSERGLAGIDALLSWLGDLGMVAATQLARQLRVVLADQELPGRVAGPQAAGLIDDLRSSASTEATGASPMDGVGERLLIVGQPSAPVDNLIWSAATAGYTIEHSAQLDEWPDETDAVLVCLSPETVASVLLACRSASERYADAPVVVLGDVDDLEQRMNLARHASSILGDLSKPAEVLQEVRRLLLLGRVQSRVIVRCPTVGHLGHQGRDDESCDDESCDDGACLNGACLVNDLQAAGITATAAEDDADLLSALGHGRATVAVLPASEDNGRLAKLIRAQPSTRQTIVLELVAEGDVGRCGQADLVIPRRLDLVAAVGDARWRLAGRVSIAHEDLRRPVGRGVPWDSARFLAERILLGVHRHNSVASVCVIRYDEADSVGEVDTVQELLMREFRSDDVVARSGDRESVLVLGGVDRDVAAARLELIASRLTTVTTVAAVAEFPFDAQSVDDLAHEARALIDESVEAAGPRVVTADWRTDGHDAVDVIIADSDLSAARVVGDALKRCGLRVRHFSDGQQLIDHLADPRLRLPKVLLLEFDLDEVDGLTVLRSLRPHAALHRFDVVMFSARTHEADLQEAFDLGVTEIIPKPFSPGILVRRLLRITGAER